MRNKPRRMELESVPMKTVSEHVESTWSRREHGAPPPAIILTAQLEIAQDDTDLGAGDTKNEEHQNQETVHIVKWIQPKSLQNEEQFDEDGSKR